MKFRKEKKKLLVGMVASLGFLTVGLTNTALNSKTAVERPVVYQNIEISHGDTLWGIAENVTPTKSNKSIKIMVDEIKRINNMETDTIKTGNFLIIPVYE